jgi:hypothetical protein
MIVLVGDSICQTKFYRDPDGNLQSYTVAAYVDPADIYGEFIAAGYKIHRFTGEAPERIDLIQIIVDRYTK